MNHGSTLTRIPYIIKGGYIGDNIEEDYRDNSGGY